MSKILVIEDDQFLGNAYKLKLSKAGFEVHVSKDGKEGLEALNAFNPDLILLDLIMPNMDGFEFLEEMQHSTHLEIPVIVASNLGQQEDLESATRLGAVDFIIKSDVSLEEVIEKINKHLGYLNWKRVHESV